MLGIGVRGRDMPLVEGPHWCGEWGALNNWGDLRLQLFFSGTGANWFALGDHTPRETVWRLRMGEGMVGWLCLLLECVCVNTGEIVTEVNARSEVGLW